MVEERETVPGGEAGRAQVWLAGLADPIAGLARTYGPAELVRSADLRSPTDPVGQLCLIVIGQVISVRTAMGIFGRLRDRLDGQVDPAGLARLDPADLRALGLSGAKARTLSHLGALLVTGELCLEELAELDDADALTRLGTIPGIGPWSAQMFLLRGLRRPDVFPAGDLVLRRAIRALDGAKSSPTVAEAVLRAAAWAPYRSYAARYLWLSDASPAQERDHRGGGAAR